ncbi:EscT/YscT/HrcT family type III secretion system export apparatus protein [Paraburkholderia azotifigens]|uniref:Flagellar biosynthetic protein FliR n=1 Tax=Paraburkholderia azotifigens TaxID=2057004 RepID=A0A5C6VMZ2_9BURK|nr:flagellar biosynthetic protein FliR [Paraburkholderia azotifigens]TXC86181.1 flagellar biosynthetic protein FliR [Paraburkholderia azotifigens]
MTAGYIGYIEGFAFCTIRPAVALALVPFGSNESLGVALRVPLMLLFATIPQVTQWPDNPVVAIAVEVLIGLTLGMLLSVVFHAAAAAGALIDQQGGYSIAASYDPNFRDEAALFEHLFGWFATLTFFTGKGLVSVYGFFADAWALWPPGAPRPDLMRVMRELAEQRLALSIVEGVRLAMPLVGLMLLVDIALGWMSRYAKRLNPFTTARTVKAIVLSLTIVSCVPVLFERFNAIFLRSAILQ